MRDYCEAVQHLPASVIGRAVEDFRLGRVDRNRTFAPSIPELLSVLGRAPMNAGEQAEYVRIKTAIEAKRERLALVRQ